jgi:hypothetical protein
MIIAGRFAVRQLGPSMGYIEWVPVITLPLGLKLDFRALFMQVVLNLHVVNTSVVSRALSTEFQGVTGTEAEAIQANRIGIKVVISVFFLGEIKVHDGIYEKLVIKRDPKLKTEISGASGLLYMLSAHCHFFLTSGHMANPITK